MLLSFLFGFDCWLNAKLLSGFIVYLYMIDGFYLFCWVCRFGLGFVICGFTLLVVLMFVVGFCSDFYYICVFDVCLGVMPAVLGMCLRFVTVFDLFYLL